MFEMQSMLLNLLDHAWRLATSHCIFLLHRLAALYALRLCNAPWEVVIHRPLGLSKESDRARALFLKPRNSKVFRGCLRTIEAL